MDCLAWWTGLAGLRLGGWRARKVTTLGLALPSVYTDNEPATRLYHRHGWSPVGDPPPHPTTAKPEQRYRLDLVPE
ncbi:hypothetical protein [Actinopolyspora mortivallis]|uniref:hypothetical protein n=1 Tax=Actinopolyspora mortivallis TaxID=33906 RepID=UPI000374EE55|nr:hypothetical protein [Actinopolyspora mortivallis]